MMSKHCVRYLIGYLFFTNGETALAYTPQDSEEFISEFKLQRHLLIIICGLRTLTHDLSICIESIYYS